MTPFVGATRDSGTTSFGDVPAHWRIERNKVIFREVNERSKGDEELLTVSHLTGVTTRAEKQDVNMFLAESTENCKRCLPQDLAINTMWAWMGALGIVPMTGIVSPSYNVYRLRHPQEHEPRFFDHFYRAAPYVAEINRYSKGVWTSRLRLYPESFLQMPVLLPPKEEQRRIADFLDRKTAAIDALIAKKDRLLELLAEKRQALVTHAVTKGLAADVPMTDSGVEWLGSVPAHWTLRMLKFVATFQRGHDLPAEQRRDGPFPVVSSGGTIGTHDIAACRGPGIVTGRYGSIGQFHLVETDFWALNTALYTKTLWGNSPRFVFYALSVLRDLFEMESKKSAVPGVDRNDLHVYSVAVPPVEEQEAIAKHLDAVVGRIDEIVRQTATSVEKLREYRQALITAAVTGKLDLSKEAA